MKEKRVSRLDKDATAERVRVARARAGKTLKQVSEASGGVSPVTLSEIERGLRTARVGTLQKIAQALGVDVGELLGFEEVPTLPKAPEPQPDSWGAAVDEARRVREDGRARMARLLTAWRDAKERDDAPATRKRLDGIGELLNEVARASNAVQEAGKNGDRFSTDAFMTEVVPEIGESRQLKGELLGMVRNAGLFAYDLGDEIEVADAA